MLIAAQVGNSPIWYVLCGILLGYLFHWFYVYFWMKDIDKIKILDSPENEKLCKWIIENKDIDYLKWCVEHYEDVRRFQIVQSDHFISMCDIWEMYKRTFDEDGDTDSVTYMDYYFDD